VSELKRIDIKEFVENGYLLEVNRQFFHRLGLALEVVGEEDGIFHLGGVHDARDDPEGFIFAESFDDIDIARAERVEQEFAEKDHYRLQKFGWFIQPIK